MATAPPDGRIVTLDVVRGVAVMGIVAMNIVAFAMPIQAYVNPAAFGSETTADYAAWAFNFIFVDGKMRGLFSFLFGASMLLVIERASAAGRSAARVHYARMVWLLVLGLAHFAFIWSGDILAGYAQVGMLAYLFHRMRPRELVRWGIALIALQTLLFAAIAASAFYLEGAAVDLRAPADIRWAWQDLEGQFGVPTAQAVAAKSNLFLGSYWPIAGYRLGHWWEPFAGLFLFGAETLAYFLIGMALLRNGFFRGSWAPERYRRAVLIGFGIGIPIYAALAWLLLRDGFGVPMIILCALAATTPVRPLMIVATAALIILLTRGGGRIADRLGAAGRAAFTNYVGTSVLLTTLFYGYGFGLYGSLSRVELWAPVIGIWAVMLLWSKPWLDRYRYGPLEWLWRSLSRGRIEPMRRGVTPA